MGYQIGITNWIKDAKYGKNRINKMDRVSYNGT